MKKYLQTVFVLFLFTAAFTVITTKAMDDSGSTKQGTLDEEQQETLDEELNTAIFWEDWDEMELLLKKGANPNNRNSHAKFGNPALHEVLSFRSVMGNTPLILLAYGADPNGENDLGRNPLHGAIHAGDMELLLERGADPNNMDTNGFTPLHQADTASKVQILLKYGADQTIRNKNGDTPLEYAVKGRKEDVAAALKE